MTTAPPAKTEPAKTEVGSYFIANYPPFSQWSRERLGEVEAVLEHFRDKERSAALLARDVVPSVEHLFERAAVGFFLGRDGEHMTDIHLSS